MPWAPTNRKNDPKPTGPNTGYGEIEKKDLLHQGRYGLMQNMQDLQALQQRLEAQSLGQGPSLAQMMMQRAGSQAMNQQQALAAGARPGMGGMAQRLAAQNSSRIGTDIAGQAAQARLQEQAAAQQQLAALIQYQQQMNTQLGLGDGTRPNERFTPGGAVGALAGGALGGYFGGPQGAMAGSQVGAKAGDWVGSLF